jgi:hypothetical protein
MDIGDKVKVVEQDITGTIIRWDSGNKVVILDDDDSWQEDGLEASLLFNVSDLELITKEVLWKSTSKY